MFDWALNTPLTCLFQTVYFDDTVNRGKLSFSADVTNMKIFSKFR